MTAVQREFCSKCVIHRNDSAPTCDAILRRVNNIRTGGSIVKRNHLVFLSKKLSFKKLAFSPGIARKIKLQFTISLEIRN